jgi:hypothetical protein
MDVVDSMVIAAVGMSVRLEGDAEGLLSFVLKVF